MARTDAEMDRLEMEFAAIDGARDEMRYLGGYGPRDDSWRLFCNLFARKLDERLNYGEHDLNHPNDYR